MRQGWERGSEPVGHPCAQHPGARSIPVQGIRRRLPHPCLRTAGARVKHEEGLCTRDDEDGAGNPRGRGTSRTHQPFRPSFQPPGAEPGGQRGTEGSSGTHGDCRAVPRLSQQRCAPLTSPGTAQAIGLFTTAGQSRLRGSISAASAAFPMRQSWSRLWPGKISFRPPSSCAIPLSQQAQRKPL